MIEILVSIILLPFALASGAICLGLLAAAITLPFQKKK